MSKVADCWRATTTWGQLFERYQQQGCLGEARLAAQRV